MRPAPVLGLLLLSACGGSPGARGETSAGARGKVAGELTGCYRVDSSELRVRGEASPAALRPLADGTTYCLDADRYSFKPRGGEWNTVLTRFAIEPIWSEPGVKRAGVAWTSPPRARLRLGLGICAIDPSSCQMVPSSEASPCPLTFVRDGDDFRLETAASIGLVPLEADEASRARAEIARLPSVDRTCESARAALQVLQKPRRPPVVELDEA